MFEVTRYFLALIVADTHLWPVGFGLSGWQAVFGFYTLSGYLMTRVLHERYGFQWSGTAAFLANRVLRLWPAYLVVVAITGLVLCFYPLSDFFFSLTVPRTLLEKVTTITILGQVGFDFAYTVPISKLAPTSWSLSIELFSYCLLALYFAKKPKRLIALAALGAVGITLATGYCVAVPSPYHGLYCGQNRYGVLQAGFIPFAAGGLAYFYREAMQPWLTAWWKWGLPVWLGAEVLTALSTFIGLTIGPFFGIVAMLALIVWDGGDKRPSPALDFIGRASYHLFIGHMSIAAILVVVFRITPDTVLVFVLSVAIAMGLSGVLVPLEWRLNRLRGQISHWGRRPSMAIEAPPTVTEALRPPREVAPLRQPL